MMFSCRIDEHGQKATSACNAEAPFFPTLGTHRYALSHNPSMVDFNADVRPTVWIPNQKYYQHLYPELKRTTHKSTNVLHSISLRNTTSPPNPSRSAGSLRSNTSHPPLSSWACPSMSMPSVIGQSHMNLRFDGPSGRAMLCGLPSHARHF